MVLTCEVAISRRSTRDNNQPVRWVVEQTLALLHQFRRLAESWEDAEVAVMSRAGHFPWVDDPATFAATVEEFR